MQSDILHLLPQRDDILISPHQFQTVDIGNIEFSGDHITGDTVVSTEVDVAGGNNSHHTPVVILLHEELPHLRGNRARVLPCHTNTATVGGTDEKIILVHDRHISVLFPDGYPRCRDTQFLHKTVGIVSDRREVDDMVYPLDFSEVTH